ncbi:MAG: tetratricopeptide repeat protein [Gammaproteobacteria bacterium]
MTNNLFLIENSVHTCCLTMNEEGNYIFYDPNYDNNLGKKFKDTTSLHKEITATLGTDFSMSLSILKPNTTDSKQKPFEVYCELLKNEDTRNELFAGSGFHLAFRKNRNNFLLIWNALSLSEKIKYIPQLIDLSKKYGYCDFYKNLSQCLEELGKDIINCKHLAEKEKTQQIALFVEILSEHDQESCDKFLESLKIQPHHDLSTSLILGDFYLNGKYRFEVDIKKAIDQLKFCANQGGLEKAIELCLDYYSMGCVENFKPLLELYKDVADDQRDDILTALLKKNSDILSDFLTQLVSEYHPNLKEKEFKEILGIFHYYSEVCFDDAQRLMAQYLSAIQKYAADNLPTAQLHLGMCYEQEELGIVSDDKKAYEFYEQAAAGGSAEAQCKMGFFYETTGSNDKAKTYYNTAAAQGNRVAYKRLADLCTLDEIPEEAKPESAVSEREKSRRRQSFESGILLTQSTTISDSQLTLFGRRPSLHSEVPESLTITKKMTTTQHCV